jgi:hypothetical protein
MQAETIWNEAYLPVEIAEDSKEAQGEGSNRGQREAKAVRSFSCADNEVAF